jgi:hypothetical protein
MTRPPWPLFERRLSGIESDAKRCKQKDLIPNPLVARGVVVRHPSEDLL